ncbi:hypothetical protein JCM3774_004376 [Rhodotorula dairenensis]
MAPVFASPSAPITVPPPSRPRLKRSHPSEPTAADVSSGSSSGGAPHPHPQPIAVPVAASPTALPTGALPWSSAQSALLRPSALDPIHELAELAPQNPLHEPIPRLVGSGNGVHAAGGGLGLDLSGTAACSRSTGTDERATKRIRVAPDHEAFGRLSLDRPASASMSPTNAFSSQLLPTSSPLSPTTTTTTTSSPPQSAVPPHLRRQPSQPLPTPPLGTSSSFPPPPPPPTAAAATARSFASPPAVTSPHAPTHTFSSPTLASASLPLAPPTSPVQPAAVPVATASIPTAAGFSPPLVNSFQSGTGVLPTVPWGQSSFFSTPPAPATVPTAAGVAAPATATATPTAPAPTTGEIEMGAANASSWDLDPHRIYVASLDEEDAEAGADECATQGTERDARLSMEAEGEEATTAAEAAAAAANRLRLNAVAARRAAEASALPAALIAQLEREASKARQGSLVLYRPPPWASSANKARSLHNNNNNDDDDDDGLSNRHELEKHEESWREFERERQRVERELDEEVHDADDEDDNDVDRDARGGRGAIMSDARFLDDGETLVGRGDNMNDDDDVGGMDVDMEL